MKKIFFTMLCLFIVNTGAMAVETCSQDQDGNCSIGCEPDGLGGCEVCSPGSYKSAVNKLPCTKCVFPTGATQKQDDVSGLTTACSWQAECDADEYWQTSTGGISTFGCTPCGEHYTSKRTQGFGLSGRGTTATGASSYSKDAVCDGIVYTITLEKNLTNFLETPKYAYVKYGTGFSANENGPFKYTGVEPGVTPSMKWFQDFLGYYTAKTGGFIRFNSEGGTTGTATNPTTFREHTTLYGRWNEEAVKFTVNYYSDSGMQTLFASSTCEMGGSCLARTDGPSQSGKVFAGWQCGAGCSGPVEPGAQIPEPTEEYYLTNEPVKLYARFESCPAGYYCASGVQNKCPAGMTTSGGASSIEDCHMVRGSSGTKFCNGTGACFTLPGTGTIPYNP